MGIDLDLDDVVYDNPKAKQELMELRAYAKAIKEERELAKLRAFWEWSRMADRQLFEQDYAALAGKE